jgi:hypothetical protein
VLQHCPLLAQSEPLEQLERQTPPLQFPMQQSPPTEQAPPSPAHWFEA